MSCRSTLFISCFPEHYRQHSESFTVPWLWIELLCPQSHYRYNDPNPWTCRVGTLSCADHWIHRGFWWCNYCSVILMLIVSWFLCSGIPTFILFADHLTIPWPFPDLYADVFVQKVVSVCSSLKIIHNVCVTLHTVNTHCHADHVTGTGLLKKRVFGVKSAISKHSGARADILLTEGDAITFGKYVRMKASFLRVHLLINKLFIY